MRQQKVTQELKKLGLKAFIADQPLQLFYLTQLSPSVGRLLVTEEEMILFVDGRYGTEAKQVAPCEVVVTPDLDKSLIERLPREGNVGFSADQSPYGRVKKWLESGCSVAPSADPIAKVREVKEPGEIVLMRKAAALAMEGVAFIKKTITPGMSEKELAVALEIFWLSKGDHHVSFSPIIAFDKGTASPHHRPTSHKWDGKSGVQIDIGVESNRYQSDVSRYILPQEKGQIHEILNVVKEAQQTAIAMLRPGVPLKELDQAARSIISKAGYGDYFPHSLGHSIGLETHESPIIRASLAPEVMAEAGMCLTIEPGIYLPDIGGVRLEETVLVTSAGAEILTK